MVQRFRRLDGDHPRLRSFGRGAMLGLAHIARWTKHPVELNALILVAAVRGVFVAAKRTLVHAQLLARGMVPIYHYGAIGE